MKIYSVTEYYDLLQTWTGFRFEQCSSPDNAFIKVESEEDIEIIDALKKEGYIKEEESSCFEIAKGLDRIYIIDRREGSLSYGLTLFELIERSEEYYHKAIHPTGVWKA